MKNAFEKTATSPLEEMALLEGKGIEFVVLLNDQEQSPLKVHSYNREWLRVETTDGSIFWVPMMSVAAIEIVTDAVLF